MVLAIEMGVVFVLLTAILIALYVAWQNAKFIGDRLKKKQVMKRLMAGGAAIVLAVAVAIGAVVTAYAATSDTDTKQTGQAVKVSLLGTLPLAFLAGPVNYIVGVILALLIQIFIRWNYL